MKAMDCSVQEAWTCAEAPPPAVQNIHEWQCGNKADDAGGTRANQQPCFDDASRTSRFESLDAWMFTFTDSGNQDYLNIEGVRAEDEAVYYCACLNCGEAYVFAQGTKLVISARGSSPPSLLLLAPSGSLLSESDVSVMCVAQGFYPEGVTMSWSEDSSSVTGDEVQTGPYQRQADGTFSQTSVLKLSKQRWSSGRTYTCRLSHSALSTPLSQSTSLDQCM
ncbi:hypothetical protein HF521_009711 [Silurus meridionalis]|uniref:Ig-like domain-containing protein n=1 Tax=Silurus meridionalis TaxID=175797 RepID=A0A8T0BUQ9_SILME|nr:hypothetical protein HF521_009711 [Silurus meridionalis]